MLLSTGSINSLAYSDTEYLETTSNKSIEEILSSYHDQIQQLEKDAPIQRFTTNDVKAKRERIQEQTVNELRAAGYEAYSVNTNTFGEVQRILSTDFDDIGLNPEYSYIVVISGEPSDASADGVTTLGAISDPFTYTYNGTTYIMRYFTITAADDPAYGKATTVNVLKSTSRQLLINCLNTVISAYISSINNILGTVASICGLSIENFLENQNHTLNMNAGTNWTRAYTQVWSERDQAWLFGSSVEYVVARSYMSGLYYSAATNRYEPVPTDDEIKMQESRYYYDFQWRKDKAVIGYIYSSIQYDVVGDVQYKYGGSTIVTHREDF